MKKVLTERDILDLIKQGKKELVYSDEIIFTPSAKDAIQKFNFKVLDKSNPESKEIGEARNISIAIGSDHTGYRLKEEIKNYLLQKSLKLEDVGTFSEQTCDYPEFAYAVAKLVSDKKYDKGIIIDATGIPSAICANKLPGIRCAIGYNEYVVKSSRSHNDSNVITFGARVFSSDIIKSLLDIWLETEFEGGRHQARLNKIADIENKIIRS